MERAYSKVLDSLSSSCDDDREDVFFLCFLDSLWLTTMISIAPLRVDVLMLSLLGVVFWGTEGKRRGKYPLFLDSGYVLGDFTVNFADDGRHFLLSLECELCRTLRMRVATPCGEGIGKMQKSPVFFSKH